MLAANVPPLLVSCELRERIFSTKIRFSSGPEHKVRTGEAKSATGLSKIRNCEKRLLAAVLQFEVFDMFF
jgi:hypothetical protein